MGLLIRRVTEKEMTKVIRIERISPRPGGVESPHWSKRGFQLADPENGGDKHLAEHAHYVRTLDEAAELIERGFSLRMTGRGKRASLISPRSLRIVRA
jgi:hypothetical protein